MLETQEVYWVSKGGPSRCRRTTSLSLKVCSTKAAITTTLAESHTDLNLSFTDEKNRITAAGGFVDFGRVNGNLALSRAIGDFEFKKSAELSPENQIVTAFPDVDVHDLTDEDEFLVLACDGKWRLARESLGNYSQTTQESGIASRRRPLSSLFDAESPPSNPWRRSART